MEARQDHGASGSVNRLLLDAGSPEFPVGYGSASGCGGHLLLMRPIRLWGWRTLTDPPDDHGQRAPGTGATSQA